MRTGRRDQDSDESEEKYQTAKIRTGRRDQDSCDEDEEKYQATKMRTGRRDQDSCDEDEEKYQATKMRTGRRDQDSCYEDEEVNPTDKENAEGTAWDDKENAECKRGGKEASHSPMEWDSDFQEGFEQALLKCDQTKEATRLDSLADRKKKQYGNASRPTSPPVREDSRRPPVSPKYRKPKHRESKATDDHVSAARSVFLFFCFLVLPFP
ncbi:protein starmaker-like [Penaeus indicus]|uniref:protein starmaker-like n=1 Tax=Penaeus indicus TaxID=29960 RepID=UPI00300C32CD